MPSKTSIALVDTLNFVSAMIVQRPQVGVNGVVNQPFLTVANKVMCTILAPPFCWEWNRIYDAVAFTTVANTSDYSVALSNFGFLEKAVINYVGTPPVGQNQSYELDVWRNIAKETNPNRPEHIAVLLDDDNGNITFRLSPTPDQAYTVDLIYQEAPIQATIITGSTGNTTWAPIPDKLQMLYETGVLAHMQMMYNQQLALSNMEIFYRTLISVAEGLSEMEKVIWLDDSLRAIRMQIAATQGTTQGKQARV